MRSVHTRRLVFLVALNLFVVLACLPAGSEPTKSVYSPPLTIPTPTPPPTLTPTPAPPATPGTVIEAMTRKHETLSTAEIDALLANFLPARNLLAAQYAVDTYRIWFQTQDRNGVLVPIQADVRFPRVETETQFPIFVYGSGTTGVATKCATLNEHFSGRDWGDYRSHLTSYSTQGYITILANWQGFDDRDSTHPYFVAELEGRVMLDAARAVFAFFDDPPAKDILARPTQDIFFGGYSQGGHGAFAGDRMAASYAPELQIRGIVGHATAPDVEGLMYDSPLYTPYIVYAYRDYYGKEIVDPADVLQEKWLSTFEDDVTTKCIDDCFTYYTNKPSQMFTSEFSDALYNNRMGEAFPAFAQKLDANYSGVSVNTTVPAIVLHGAADPIVKLHTIERFVAAMCDAGKSVAYKAYPGVNHFQTRQHGFVDSLQWMQGILDGNAPTSSCSSFASQQ